LASGIAERRKTVQEDKKMRQLYRSNYTGIPAYLMDFGFGGFLGYGKGVPGRLVKEELKRRKMLEV